VKRSLWFAIALLGMAQAANSEDEEILRNLDFFEDYDLLESSPPKSNEDDWLWHLDQLSEETKK